MVRFLQRMLQGVVMTLRKSLIGAACIGAGVMFLLDPDKGKRRLSLVRDQCVKAGKRTGRLVQGGTRDLKNRVYGLYCETRSLLGDRCDSENPRTRRAS